MVPVERDVWDLRGCAWLCLRNLWCGNVLPLPVCSPLGDVLGVVVMNRFGLSLPAHVAVFSVLSGVPCRNGAGDPSGPLPPGLLFPALRPDLAVDGPWPLRGRSRFLYGLRVPPKRGVCRAGPAICCGRKRPLWASCASWSRSCAPVMDRTVAVPVVGAL